MYIKEFKVHFATFKKTKEEKKQAKKIKQDWKNNMILYHGADWRKHNNYPFTLKDI